MATLVSPTTAHDVQKKANNSLFQLAHISSWVITGHSLSMLENVSVIVVVMANTVSPSMFPSLVFRDE